MFETIEEENLLCFYDSIKQIAIVSLSNTLVHATLVDASQWLERLLTSPEPVYGVLINLMDAKKFELEHFNAFQVTRGLPIAFLVTNSYQERVITQKMDRPENSKVVNSFPDAFEYLRVSMPEGRSVPDRPHISAVLDSDGASAYYHAEWRRMFVTYYGTVTPKSTAEVYGTITGTFVANGVGDVLGAVFDFRYVTGFENSNLNAVRNTSTNLNTNYDMNHIAVALIVGTLIQERMVLVAMKVTPQEERKRVVHSFGEADAFIAEFHEMRAARAKNAQDANTL